MFCRTQLRIKKLYNISMSIEFQEFYQKKIEFQEMRFITMNKL